MSIPNSSASSSSIGPRHRSPPNYRYKESHPGQCKVMIERASNSNGSNIDFDRFKFAKLFKNMYQNSIVDFNSSGFGKHCCRQISSPSKCHSGPRIPRKQGLVSHYTDLLRNPPRGYFRYLLGNEREGDEWDVCLWFNILHKFFQ